MTVSNRVSQTKDNELPGIAAGPLSGLLRLDDGAFCAIVTLACMIIVIAAGVVAGSVPPAWQGNWIPHIVAAQPHLVDRFFAFDSRWYDNVATYGYNWDPAHPDISQNIAFFPLWPMLLRIIGALAPDRTAGSWAVVILAGSFAAASIFAFHQVARHLLESRPARIATLLYGFAPCASFLLLAYPTGLIGMLCSLALLALLQGRFLMAASLTGLATAVGPLALGTAIAVCLCAAAQNDWSGWPRLKTLLFLGLCGALSTCGLLLFIAWQAVALDDPFAFVHAQAAWGTPIGWPQRALNWFAHMLITTDVVAALSRLGRAIASHSLIDAQAELENAQNLVGESFMLVGVVGCMRANGHQGLRGSFAAIVLQGLLTIGLYEWFGGASRPGYATLRLIYPAIGGFIGIAWLLRRQPGLSLGLVALSGIMLFCNVLLIGTGYHII